VDVGSLAAVLLIWLGATGGLEPLRAVAVTASTVGIGLWCATLRWSSLLDVGRGGGVGTLVVALSGNLLGLALLSGVSTTSLPPHDPAAEGSAVTVSVGACLVLSAVAALTWREARRRWST
jgi:hypothetical protein